MQKYQISKGRICVHNAVILGMHKTPKVSDQKMVRSETLKESNSGELDFEKEFYIILDSAIRRDLSMRLSYVFRTREMSRIDRKNFFALAAETVVACYRNKHSNLHKFYGIQNCLQKARAAVNCDAENEVDALKKIEELADKIIDIFDY